MNPLTKQEKQDALIWAHEQIKANIRGKTILASGLSVELTFLALSLALSALAWDKSLAFFVYIIANACCFVFGVITAPIWSDEVF